MGWWDVPAGRTQATDRGIGRRGSLSMIYEALISLLLIAIFIIAVFPYIFEHANGEAYFSKFYATDLATSADLVNAGYGDVVLRYDNLKPNLDLTFWFTNGIITVAKTEVFLSTDVIVDTATLGTATPKPMQATTAYYGKAQQYTYGDAMRAGASEVITKPVFLVLRKHQNNFAITEAQTGLRSCPAVVPVIAREDAVITFDMTGPGAERIEARTAQLLKDLNLKTGADGNVRIAVEWKNGDVNKVEAMPTSPDGKAYACLVGQRLRALTLAEFQAPAPSSSGTDFTVKMTITSYTPLSEEQMAQALANALAVYYR